MKYQPTEFNGAISLLSRVDRRLAISFGIVILGLMFTVLVAGGLYLKGIMDKEEHQLSTLLTRVLASSVSQVSFSGKYHAQLLLEDIQQEQPDIRYLLITDLDAHVLASSVKQKIDTRLEGEPLSLAMQALQQANSSPSRRFTLDNESILEITLPYVGGFDASVQGVIQVGISQQSREAALNRGIVFMFMLVLLLFSVGMFVVLRLSRYFGQPVQLMASDMVATLQAIPDLLFELDHNGRYIQVLAHKVELLADSRDRLLGKTIHEVLPKEAADVVNHALQEAGEYGESHGKQFALTLPPGTIWFELSVARKQAVGSDKPHYIVLSRDITERKKTEDSLYLYANVFEHSGEAILITDRDNQIIAINPSLTKYTGYTIEDLRGKNPRILASGHTPRETYPQIWKSLEEFDFWQGELWDRRKDGGSYPKWAAISAIRNNAGDVTHYIASYTDISERKAAEERIEFVAHHDVLTGLYNRFSFELRLEQAMSTARREDIRLAVVFIDMDRFKNINDTMGHHTGDILLMQIAKRIEARVRESDIVARLGGDEFVIVLTAVKSAINVATITDQIMRVLREPYHLADRVLHITPSIGISLFPSDGEDVETLMKNADAAMYHAKEKGRNNFQFFTASMNEAIAERLLLENELREALQQGDFVLYYQPIFTVNSHPCGVEALVRWIHPKRGLIPPDKFISIAEDTGLIIPLGAWVVEEACRQCAIWRAAGFDDLSVAVNISVHQLYSSNFMNHVRDTMSKHAIGEGELKFEITESAAMENPEHAIRQLQQLRELGIELAIDDFGTGYSSLAYIKRLPIQMLKLDRTFVDDIGAGENDAAICAATVALAHNLGLKVVAEGVESEIQRKFLVAHQCDFLQGFLFSKPLPAQEAIEVVREYLGKRD